MKYKNANISRIGVSVVSLIVNKEFNWIFREQATDDYGIDAHIEICMEGRPTGRMIAVQIKSGESYFSKSSKFGYLYSGNARHLEYWLAHSLPVIIIIYNPNSQDILWVQVDRNNLKQRESNWTIEVPFTSRFDKCALGELVSIAFNEPQKNLSYKKILKHIDAPNSQIGISELLNILSSATKSLDLAFYNIDVSLFWVLKTLSHNVDTRLLTNNAKSDDLKYEFSQSTYESPNMKIRFWDEGNLHCKFFVIDKKFLVLGSFNLSSTSLRRNSYDVFTIFNEQNRVDEHRKLFQEMWTEASNT